MQIAAALLLLGASGARGGPLATIHTSGGAVAVVLELATTPEAQERGLMYRTALADDHGMLFVFADDSDHQFWMKNTLIPLDMLFIARDDDGGGHIVGIRADATPLSTAALGVGKPSRYVLEVPGGYAARRKIAPGDRVDFAGVGPP